MPRINHAYTRPARYCLEHAVDPEAAVVALADTGVYEEAVVVEGGDAAVAGFAVVRAEGGVEVAFEAVFAFYSCGRA